MLTTPVLFTHQSVGENIVDGICDIEPALPVVEIGLQGESGDAPALYHARLGQNGDPYGKIDAFVQYILKSRTRFGIAMMKLCYADISGQTNISRLYDHYIAAAEMIRLNRPETRLIHFTIPIRSIRLGARSFLRLLIGRRVELIEDNIQRESYNTLIRNRASKDEPLFDLARLESVDPAGQHSAVRYYGDRVPSLSSALTDDGGHLNQYGRQTIARALLATIHETQAIQS